MNAPEPKTLRIGLIGLGLMGRGMGLSILRAGHSLNIVAHRRRETAVELVAAGAREYGDPSALAAGSDAIVLCLPSLAATDAVLFGERGIAQGAASGLLVIECSTLMPSAALDFSARLAPHGVAFVDAPVTRGPREAAAGTLNALVGGMPADAARAARVLDAFCEKLFHFNAPGQGYAAKLISNFLAFSNLAAVAEGMATAHAAGLDMPLLMQALAVGGAQSRVLDGLAPVIAGTGESRSIVTIATAYKDVAYYRDFAGASRSAGPVADNVARQFGDAMAAGLGERLTPEYLAHVMRRNKKSP